jgi:hypothetical protein
MMRNVALGAVLGFALVVLGLSIFGKAAPPVAPEAPAAAPIDAGAAGVAEHLAPGALHSVARPASSLARVEMMRRLSPPSSDGGT